MCIAAVLVAVEGTWSMGLYRHWSYLILIAIACLSLIAALLSDCKRGSIYGLLSHCGLLLVLLGGYFGRTFKTDVHLVVRPRMEVSTAYDVSGNIVQLPFSASMEEFLIDYYDDGTSPKQFTTRLSVDGKSLQTSVNHPCSYKGYIFYQSDYGADYSPYSVLRVVRNPLLPLLLAAALMLFIAAMLALKEVWSGRKMLLCSAAVAVVFGVISVAKINFGTLMPALRSIWFIPHLCVYMLAYSLLAAALLTGILSLFSSKVPSALYGRLLRIASALLLIGMLCGAVWAQVAWGEYWSWDAKECWAAVTWLLTIAGGHLGSSSKRLLALLTALSFLAMQMTWYGVNYLPSSEQSLHTYNI